jgi:perosamine synthetase
MKTTHLSTKINSQFEWPTWPRYGEEHEQAVVRVIRSNQLFAAAEVAAFEQEFATCVGSDYALGLGNATEGLQLALAALGVGTGDEVIVTPYSWISSASCVLMQNAIPVFVDIEPESFGLCPQALERAITPRTKAVILVHMFGLSSKIKEIRSICQAHNLFLIEDASHAHGAKYEGKHLGGFADIGVFSLHQRKAISTGDGGVVCTDNPEVYEKIRRMRSFGSDQLSYNYRMTEFAAALGRVGLKYLSRDNEIRTRNHRLLSENIDCEGVRVIKADPDSVPVFYSNLIDLNLTEAAQQRILSLCSEAGIPLKRTWQPLNKHPHFKRQNMANRIAPWEGISSIYVEPENRILPTSIEFQERRLFEIDCHPLVSEEEVIYAARVIREACNHAS